MATSTHPPNQAELTKAVIQMTQLAPQKNASIALLRRLVKRVCKKLFDSGFDLLEYGFKKYRLKSKGRVERVPCRRYVSCDEELDLTDEEMITFASSIAGAIMKAVDNRECEVTSLTSAVTEVQKVLKALETGLGE